MSSILPLPPSQPLLKAEERKMEQRNKQIAFGDVTPRGYIQNLVRHAFQDFSKFSPDSIRLDEAQQNIVQQFLYIEACRDQLQGNLPKRAFDHRIGLRNQALYLWDKIVANPSQISFLIREERALEIQQKAFEDLKKAFEFLLPRMEKPEGLFDRFDKETTAWRALLSDEQIQALRCLLGDKQGWSPFNGHCFSLF